MPVDRARTADYFPIGASITIEQLDADPHPLLARLREREPVSWIPALDGWLVCSYEVALEVMRDPVAFTVDDPRFSTAQVIGQSMLSLDGREHTRHRAPFAAPFRPHAVRERFETATEQTAQQLIDQLRPAGAAELRRAFAGPLAAAIVARALGLEPAETQRVLGWYDKIVAAVTEITSGGEVPTAGREAFGQLRTRVEEVISGGQRSSLLASAAADSGLTREQIVSNAAVLLFGGIETTEGMIANAVLHLLQHPELLPLVRSEPALLDSAVEESLRLEPAASVIDRYATADIRLGPAAIRRGDLVRVSIAGANRDPDVFPDPDRFELRRPRRRGHIAFAHGPHVCVGLHLARLETRIALTTLLRELPVLRLERPAEVRGLVFRKPRALHVAWSL